MTDSGSPSSEKRRERIGLLKHVCAMSLAVVVYSGQRPDIDAFDKFLVSLLLMSVIFSTAALCIDVAKINKKFFRDEKKCFRRFLVLSIFFFICGCFGIGIKAIVS